MEFRDFECKGIRYVQAVAEKPVKMELGGRDVEFDPIPGHRAFFEAVFETNIIHPSDSGGTFRTTVSIVTATGADEPPLTGHDTPLRQIERTALRGLVPVIRALADEIAERASASAE